MLKKLNVSFIMAILGICCFALSGCSKKCDFEEVRIEFNQYQIDSDIAIVYADRIIYFDDHSIRLRDLAKHSDSTGPYLWHISKKYIYFAKTYKNDSN